LIDPLQMIRHTTAQGGTEAPAGLLWYLPQ